VGHGGRCSMLDPTSRVVGLVPVRVTEFSKS
jgi:hypothetical protein